MTTNGCRDLASIIVPCWNQLEFTRHCISSLMRHTRPPWELILVDNGSADGTRDYCAGVHDASSVPVTVVTNATNLGFPAAINQGLEQAHGEYLVLLNNDVVVTDAWLDQLVALANAESRQAADEPQNERAEIASTAECAKSAKIDAVDGEPGIFDFNELLAERRRGSTAVTVVDPIPPSTSQPRMHTSFPAVPIGLVGPMSNFAAPPQLVEGVPYHDLEAMHGFARRWRSEHLGNWFNVRKLSGFCLLMKRAVYERIGGLDERFAVGLFDDDDLAMRARNAGFQLAVAHDLFVHHFGSRSFVGNGIDAEALLNENAQRFAAKWGLPNTGGRRVSLRPFTVGPQNGSRNGSDPQSQNQGGNRPQMTPMDADKHARMISESCSETGPTGEAVQLSEPCPGGRAEAKPAQPASWSDLPAPSSRLVSHLRPSESSADNNLLSFSSGPANRLFNRPRSADKQARVSLTMIVKNEHDHLPHCLQSAAGLFDEIVVVDTGSTDDTIEIARSFGANVFEFPWVDSFSAARNESLEHATGDYAFWLDADDIVEPGEREKLQGLLDRLRAGELPTASFIVRCACDPGPDGTGGNTVVDHVRLFPIRDDVRWKYRVHEQILPALRRAGVPDCWTDIVVRHTGYSDLVTRAGKLDRDLRLCHMDQAEMPDDPFVLFNLGAISVERCRWRDALGFLGRSLARSAPSDSIVRKLYALIARVHQMTGDTHVALQTCISGLKLDPDDAELLFRKAVVHRYRGESRAAEGCWRRCLELERPNRFCSFDQGIYGHLTRRNLAILAAERGDLAEARKLWREVLAECPGDPEATARLASAG
jgi:glycosyltransferase involved in cell wall biosynthesis